MDDAPWVSEALYVGLCHHIGAPTYVTLRRELIGMEEMIQRPIKKYNKGGSAQSGSFREGFRFKSSDRDYMVWTTYGKLISEMSNFDGFCFRTIFMEQSFAPPGYVRLKLLNPPRQLKRDPSVVKHMNHFYLSSEKISNAVYHCVSTSSMFAENLRPHGPCSNFYIGDIENDYVTCYACQYWPHTAYSWITRCKRKEWPPKHLLNEVISNGCHVIPVGSHLMPDENELEWRLSFSQAELQMVYSFNHTQFLCYGMLKIFLREVLCSSKHESLICSYFLKTVLFWEIQNNPVEEFWCPSNLLFCFWTCFKRLCKCVYDSCCPNFIIPGNNMFRNKVFGAPREALLTQLLGYYEMGVECLKLSPTICSIVAQAHCDESFSEGHVVSLLNMDMTINAELIDNFCPMFTIEDCYLKLKSISSLLQQPLSPFQSLALQFSTSDGLAQTSFLLAKHSANKRNKIWYKLDKKIINMLRLSSSIGHVSQILCLGVYFYNTERYHKVQDILKIFKQTFSRPFILFDDRGLDRIHYLETIGMYSLDKRMRKAWMHLVYFPIFHLT